MVASFKVLSVQAKQALLIKGLLTETEGKLTKEHYAAIAQYILPAYEYTEEKEVKVIHDAKAFAEYAKLTRSGMEHSWAGERTTVQTGEWIVGDGEFGSQVSMTYSQNGDCTREESESSPNFDIASCQAIAIHQRYFDNFNRSGEDDEEKLILVIYIPETNPFPVDPAIAAIMETFNL